MREKNNNNLNFFYYLHEVNPSPLMKSGFKTFDLCDKSIGYLRLFLVYR